MTVVTPGGPCLTQTQIFRDEQLARFEAKREAKAEQAPQNPYGAASLPTSQTQTPGAVTAPEATGAAAQTSKSYGAPGPHTVDISV